MTYRRNVAGHFDLSHGMGASVRVHVGQMGTHGLQLYETQIQPRRRDAKTTVKLDGVKNYEFFDCPGEYPEKKEGDALVRVRMEEEEVGHDVVHGSGICRSFTPGGKFKIKEHLRKDEEGKSYVITSVIAFGQHR